MTPALLACAGLEAGYGDLSVVRGVSLTVGAGELVALVGANGSGKSTTLRALAGQLRPKAGSVVFAGRRADGLPPGFLVGLGLALVPEGRAPFPEMSVRDNLTVGFEAARHRARRCPPAALGPTTEPAEGQPSSRRVSFRERLERVHGLFPVLAARARQAAGTLSGGEQQMLAIGRALMSGPRLLLLDEPSLGLGPRMVDGVFGAVERLRASGVAVLLVEQNVARALAAADRGYVLRDGRIVAEGSGQVLLRSDVVRQAYLGL